MKWFQPTLIGIVVLACFFLYGFKKPIKAQGETLEKKSLANQKHPPKYLDLEVPLRKISFQEMPEISNAYPGHLSEPIAKNKSISRKIELQGRFIMSQEPEIEKTKSADGAGIVINIRQ